MISASSGAAIDLGALVMQPALAGAPSRGVCRFTGQTIACELQASADGAIREHAAATPRLEVGGLLIGTVYDTAHGGFHVDVAGALPARRAISGAGHLRFGIAAWLDLVHQRRQRLERVVGWYHTHPAIGVFLSSADRVLHGAFFSGIPWYLALVFDPACDDLGVFARDPRALVQLTATADGGVPGDARKAAT